jgi:hypothetical protein
MRAGPGAGASAILELSHVIQSLFALNDLERGITVNVGTIDGGLRPNVIAPHSRAVVDVRVATGQDQQRVEAAIRGLQPAIAGTALTIEGGFGRPAMERTPANRALWQLACRLGSELGLELEEALAGGGSDGNFTSQFTATLDGMGAVGDGAHARHEHLRVQASIERTALLVLLLLAPPLTTAPAESSPMTTATTSHSVTRCSDLWIEPFDTGILDRADWATGDFVAGRVVGERNRVHACETKSGRMTEVVRGDLLIGALGRRAATLEGVGDWRAVTDDLRLEALTSAGCWAAPRPPRPCCPI